MFMQSVGSVQFEANRASEQAFKVSFSLKYGSENVWRGGGGGVQGGLFISRLFRK